MPGGRFNCATSSVVVDSSGDIIGVGRYTYRSDTNRARKKAGMTSGVEFSGFSGFFIRRQSLRAI